MTSTNGNRLPLEGIRILDLTVVWAGPYATQIFADWGAEIIRVESIKHFPSTTRGMVMKPTKAMVSQIGSLSAYPERDPGERPWNRVASFNAHARNKKSMTVDMTQPEGQDVFDALLRISDVVIENNVPVSMERVNINWERVSAVNPRIVMLRVPAFGLDGPYKNYRTFGSHMAGVVGHYSVMGYPGESADMTGNTLTADAAGGAGGALALAAGIRYRNKMGKGLFIEISTAENFATYLGDYILDYTMNGRLPELEGNRDKVFAPQGVYPCQGEDRWIAVSVTSDDEWQALCRVMERPELAQDARYATLDDRRAAQDDLDAEIMAWTVLQDAQAAMHSLQEAGVPTGVVMNEVDAFSDPHLDELGFWERLEAEEVGSHLYTSTLWTAARTPRKHKWGPPRLGEDNQYVYKELLNFSDEEYQRFEQQGHIGMDYDIGPAD